MGQKNDSECYKYLCKIDLEICQLLCARLENMDIYYYIDMFKSYDRRIKKTPARGIMTFIKKESMIEQLAGIILAYELVYSNQMYDSDSDDYVINDNSIGGCLLKNSLSNDSDSDDFVL